MCLGSGIVFLDSTVVALALKRIGQDLPTKTFGILEAQSYVNYGYLVTLSSLLILAGALTDYHGRRRMFGLGLISFGLTSLLCGVAPTMELLIVFRILQGAAGALLVPGALSIITSTFEGVDRGRAFGVWAGASAATTILGPLVGGILVNTVSWRAAFFINIPLVLIAYYATARHMPESRDMNATGRFDWAGSLLIVLAVSGLSFGPIRGEQTEWRGAVPFVSLVVGAAAAIAFPILMSRLKHPLVRLELFKSRNFSVTNISTFVIYGALYVTFTFLSIFMVGTLGYDEQGAGLAGLPSSLFLVFLSPRFGVLGARFGPRIFMSAGPAVMAIGVMLLALVPADSTPWVLGKNLLPPVSYFKDILPGMTIFGIGVTVMVAPLTTALMTSVPPERSGIASAINNAISRVGAPIVSALIFVVIATSFYNSIAEQVPGVDTSSTEFRSQVAPLNPPRGVDQQVELAARTASTKAFSLAMMVAATLLVIGAAVNGIGIRNPKTDG